MLRVVACSLCVAMGMRAPVPRMALDNAGAAIAIRGLDVWAGSNNLIEPFDWRIMPRERWSLLGPNGCGKSTLLRTIAAAATDATERGELSNTIAVNPRPLWHARADCCVGLGPERAGGGDEPYGAVPGR